MGNESGTHWLKDLGTRFRERYDEAVERVDHSVGWDKLPRVLGLLALVGIRNTLRRRMSVSRPDLPQRQSFGYR